MQRGGVPLPKQNHRGIELCKLSTYWGEAQIRLAFLWKTSPKETVELQQSHLITLLTLCARSKTTHLVLAVSSVLQTGSKRNFNVLHCYALIWDGD